MGDRKIFQNENSSGVNDYQVLDYLIWWWNHKWWVLSSVIVCVCVAGIYLYMTPGLYTHKAAVMLKVDSKSGSGIRELDAFKDFGLFNMADVNVNNEIETLSSPILMAEVVRRLNLNVTYHTEGWLRDEDMYGQSPVNVVFTERPVFRDISFSISRDSGSVVSLSGFRANGIGMDAGTVTARLSDTVETPVGNVVVFPTLRFSDHFDVPVVVDYSDVMLVAGLYLKRLAVNLAAKQTTIIALNFTDHSVRRSDDVLNMLISAYNDDWVKYMNESAMNTSKFIAERLDVIERELGVVDTDIEQFKSENKLMDIQMEATSVSHEASVYSGKAFELSNQLSIAGYIKEYLEDQANTLALLPGNSGLSNQNIESQISGYNLVLLQREKLIANSSDKNPLIGDMNTSLDMMRQSIVHSIDNLIETLRLQATKIEEQESQIAGLISSAPGKAKQLLSIERQQKIKEALYLYLLQKREENELSSSLVVNNTRLLTPASGSDSPVSPKKGLIFLIAITLGLISPVIYWRTREAVNTTVRDRADLSGLTIPFAGEIPLIEMEKKGRFRKNREVRKIVVEDKNRNVINEAFRVVRTNMDFMNAGDGMSKVTMFTSFYPGSGKTFITMNLALSLALKGEKVVVIDLDMRKASLSRFLDFSRIGISDFLGCQVPLLDDVIVRGTVHPNLDVIPVGTIPPNPTELLLNSRFDEMIGELRSRYDYIYIDCPPLDVVADASIVGKVSDMVVFVVRAGLMDRRMLPEVESVYQEKRFKKMAVILNGTNHLKSQYGYRRYGYHYE